MARTGRPEIVSRPDRRDLALGPMGSNLVDAVSEEVVRVGARVPKCGAEGPAPGNRLHHMGTSSRTEQSFHAGEGFG